VKRSIRRVNQKLYELAELQGGFFTTKQARAGGFADNTHPYHVKTGNWIRVHRGIYRLAQFPPPERPDLVLWYLWSRNRSEVPQGVYSHETALALHELSDSMPAKLHMTVPPEFHRFGKIPAVLRLHRANLTKKDVEEMNGVKVTRPLLTIADIVASGKLSFELQQQSIREAIDRGLVTRKQLENMNLSRRARQRMRKLLNTVPA
jgi:predicted transcriptional regulator of viral defense system